MHSGHRDHHRRPETGCLRCVGTASGLRPTPVPTHRILILIGVFRTFGANGGFTGDSRECIGLGLQLAVVFARVPKFDVVSSSRFDYYRANRCRAQDHFER